MRDAMTRRTFLGDLGAVGALGLAGRGVSPERVADDGRRWKGSALGSLYPFVKQQQQRTRQSLAFLNRRPKDLEQWKAEARARVVELLSYRPEACAPAAQILERVDLGDHVRERLVFQSAPEVTVPAYVLIPKRARGPVPAVVALSRR